MKEIKKLRKIILVSFWMLMCTSLGFSQNQVVKLTLEDVIRIARDQSPDAFLAKNNFRTSYWQYHNVKASYLPSLTLNSTLPNFNRSISWNDDTQGVVEKNSLTNYGQLSLSQDIGVTGGTLAVSSNLQQVSKMGAGASTYYISTPANISYNQPIFAYNSMKWELKIQPLVFDKAKKVYIKAMESVTTKAISNFFGLLLAQSKLRLAEINYHNSDTLYRITRQRFGIASVTQNDLLQMQLTWLNASATLASAGIQLESQRIQLRTFLGYNENIDFELVLPENLPLLTIDLKKVTDLAVNNCPDMLDWKIRLLEATRDVLQAKGQQRTVNLFVSYGINHNATSTLSPAYQAPFNDKEQVQVGIKLPLVDWGKNHGNIRMAQSNETLTSVQVKQEQQSFLQNVTIQVMQFNLQHKLLSIATTTDSIAQYRYAVNKERFLIGKVDVLNLNDALTAKDNARQGYITALQNYWDYFYTLRQLTLYDFLKDQSITEEYDALINK